MEVVVEDKQLSLAIGKKGQNVRLAAKLTGWRIDIKSEEEKRREVEAQFGRRSRSAAEAARPEPPRPSGRRPPRRRDAVEEASVEARRRRGRELPTRLSGRRRRRGRTRDAAARAGGR